MAHGAKNSSTNKKLLGIWDTTKIPVTLGRLIIFYELLQAELYKTKASANDVCFLADHTFPPYALDLYQNLKHCKKSFLCSTRIYSDTSKYMLVWPRKRLHVADLDSTISLQKFYQKQKLVPQFSFKQSLINQSVIFLKSHKIKYPITVHLKTSVFGVASLKIWQSFFQYVEKHEPRYTFIILGEDEISNEIGKLPNIVLAKNHTTSLSLQLALILVSQAFMGIVSGPANCAIFSKVPYMLFKHPKQHPGFFENELHSKDHFPFATNRQKLYLEFPSLERLKNTFLMLTNNKNNSI